MNVRTTLCLAATVAAIGWSADSAQGAINPTGDTYTVTSTNYPVDHGPAVITFDGIAETVGSTTYNEAFWPWPGGVITGETYDGTNQVIENLDDWLNPGTIIEFTLGNADPSGPIHSNPFGNATLNIDGVDLNNGSAVPEFYEGAWYFYFTDGGVPLPFQTGVLYFDTEIWVGEHPILDDVEVYYIDYGADLTAIFGDPYAGGFNASSDVSLSQNDPTESSNLFALMSALILDVVLADPFADLDGAGYGMLISQATPELPGDGNGDGWVDGLDYLIWASNFGTHPGADGDISDGDYNDDGWIDGLDYLLWASNFGTHNVSTSVPEPGTFAMAGLAMVGLMTTRRRRR